MRLRYGLVFLCSLANYAAAHPALDAMIAQEKNVLANWHYRVTETNGKTITVSTHNPEAPKDQAWSLESIEGRAPTAQELEKFRKRKADATPEQPIQTMLDEKTLVALEPAGNARRWSFRFKPSAEMDGVDPDKFIGTVSVGADGQVEQLEMKTRESFRMKLIMKINSVVSRTEFSKVANGALLPTLDVATFDASMAGHAINMTTTKRYEYIKPKAGS